MLKALYVFKHFLVIAVETVAEFALIDRYSVRNDLFADELEADPQQQVVRRLVDQLHQIWSQLLFAQFVALDRQMDFDLFAVGNRLVAELYG